MKGGSKLTNFGNGQPYDVHPRMSSSPVGSACSDSSGTGGPPGPIGRDVRPTPELSVP